MAGAYARRDKARRRLAGFQETVISAAEDASGAVAIADPRQRTSTENHMDFELFRQTCQQFLRTSSQFLGLAAAACQPALPLAARQPGQPVQTGQQPA
ncbi:hypothetical protein N234_15360 [Ralstonia pickettii DTP0602]|nr:hypothetical protein N234_15360 [Ralstonia pickettii DTP0602]